MVKKVTLDSSVLVSAFVKGDKFRPIARLILEKIFSGDYHATASVIVPVEVCGSISRKAGRDKAEMAGKQLSKWVEMKFISYIELSERRVREAMDLATKLRVRGMDAIIIQAAKEKKRILVTFDEEMAKEAKTVVKVLTAKDLVRRK
jgi:predicted nucleic acid-binding protein